jgi:hypothetical protein
MSPDTKVSRRPTGASFDHPSVRPLLWLVPELVSTMVVSQRLPSCKDNRVGLGSAFEVLEPYAGKLARTVLRGAGGGVSPPGLLGGGSAH